jgi:hypothetical protein
VRFRFAATRLTFERFATFFFERLPFFFATMVHLLCGPSVAARSGAVKLPDRYSSQSRSRSFFGRYSSVMKLMPRRESASSSNFTPDFTISWISCCHCFAWNHG